MRVYYNCPKTIIKITFPRRKTDVIVEMFNCNEEYLKTVRKVICVHPANHSVALFLKMMDKADLCLYCHPLLSKESSKEYVISYTQKFNYPLVILTRDERIEDLMIENTCMNKWRRWCTRFFKIFPIQLFYKKFIPSGVNEYIGIQKFQSKERGQLNPELHEDTKSQVRYKIYSELPIFYKTEQDNLKRMRVAGIKPFKELIVSSNRYGCFLCPFASEAYYQKLKTMDPETYQYCCELMQIGSQKSIDEGKREERYYFYTKSKIM
jgi:3'-phosphoadenosine 5'-phosphosulfate sulfotransferase (PAPS reductase)/FAD synthetase